MKFRTLINKLCNFLVRIIGFRIVLLVVKAKVKKYKPKSKNFIVIANHSDGLDPIYITCSLRKYVRFVAGDHTIINPLEKFIYKTLLGWIVKYRDDPASVLLKDMKASAEEGVPTGLFVEGAITPNGETGFFSPRTGDFVKNLGVSLITYRIKGGFFHTPRWGTGLRHGPIRGKVMGEYSAEELSRMTGEEVNEIIKRDIYVNAFEEQRKKPIVYKGKNLAEHVERVLYVCPYCEQVGTLHSKGDYLTCDCGYQVEFGKDGFFHPSQNDIVFDNVLDWDKWQRHIWKQEVLTAPEKSLIYEEKNQILCTMIRGKRVKLSDDASIHLYKDRFELRLNSNQAFVMPMEKLKTVINVSVQSLMFIDDEHFLYLKSKEPTSMAKYVAAWRYLIGKDYK